MKLLALSPFLAGCAALTLAACSPSAPLTALGLNGANPFDSRARALPSAAGVSRGLIFVSDDRSNAIDIYVERPPHFFVGTITKGIRSPNAEAVDAAGDLFVANVGGPTVTEYAPGSELMTTYTDGLTNPLTLAVGPDGTLYVVNYYSIGKGSAILEYPPKSTEVGLKIRLTGGAEGLALDGHNNLYVGYNTPSGGRILEFPPRSKHGKDLGISLGFAGGLAFDGQGNLLACDQTGPVIDVFPPGATQPSAQLKSDKIADPYLIAFDRHFHRLYVADSSGRATNLYYYAYPVGKIAGAIPRSNPAFGVAVRPAAF